MLKTVSLVMASAVGVVAAGCSTSLGSAKHLEDSTSPVLHPVDTRFSTDWFFFVEDSPDNYTFRANWEIRPPRSDGPYDVIGYQVQDPQNWKGGGEYGDPNPAYEGEPPILHPREAFKAAIPDSLEPSVDGPCQTVRADPAIVRCEYKIADDQAPMGIFVRHFESTSTVMLVGDDLPNSLEYIAGEFDEVPLSEAAEEWYESTDYS